MITKKQISGYAFGILGVLSLGFFLSTFGVNDNGFRTVIQYPSGHTFVKSTPGWYFDRGGSTYVYPDVLTHDFEKKGQDGVSLGNGVGVRYQDGGTGAIYGIARFTLPTNEQDMLELHRAFRSEQGVRDKLISPVIQEALNLTAGLMTSEEAYAERRNEYLAWSEDQVKMGKYLTTLVERTQIVEPEERNAEGILIKRAVTRVQNIPEIEMVDGIAQRGESPFVDYDILVSGFQLVDWTFEPRTLDQIQEKRAANMAIITSQANAARANQERIQMEAEGEKNVAEAKYREEVKKIEAIVIAERNEEVATIDANRNAEVARIIAAQQVEVNRQNYLAQEQDVLASEQEAMAIVNRATALAEEKTLILEADGALQQKLETYESVMTVAFQEFAKQKWTPEIIMGSSAGGGDQASGGAAQDMIQLLTTTAARDLGLDMSIRATRSQNQRTLAQQ